MTEQEIKMARERIARPEAVTYMRCQECGESYPENMFGWACPKCMFPNDQFDRELVLNNPELIQL